jgi:hypothetical protein
MYKMGLQGIVYGLNECVPDGTVNLLVALESHTAGKQASASIALLSCST